MTTTQARSSRIAVSQVLFIFIIAAAFVSLACAASNQPAKGDQSAPQTPAPEAAQATSEATSSQEAAKKASVSAAPKLTEVQEAVTRVCQDSVTIDASRKEPFIVGDFNGDGSQDLAVIVKPAKGALPKLNSEYANWIVEDPQRVALPDPNKAVQQLPRAPGPVQVQQDDVLLLILHGYQQAGWRHQYARQTFLLRNAVGENIRAQSKNEMSKTPGSKKPQPQIPGDVITEKLAGQDGFLYWTNAKYAWHH